MTQELNMLFKGMVFYQCKQVGTLLPITHQTQPERAASLFEQCRCSKDGSQSLCWSKITDVQKPNGGITMILKNSSLAQITFIYRRADHHLVADTVSAKSATDLLPVTHDTTSSAGQPGRNKLGDKQSNQQGTWGK